MRECQFLFVVLPPQVLDGQTVELQQKNEILPAAFDYFCRILCYNVEVITSYQSQLYEFYSDV